jgi:hypothetical protein
LLKISRTETSKNLAFFKVLKNKIPNFGMSFTRQSVIVFLFIWLLLIYIFITKLNTSGSEKSEESQKLIRALAQIESSKRIDSELRNILDEFTNEGLNNDLKLDFIKKISQSSHSQDSAALTSHSNGNPSIEYENFRRRVQNNIGEFWNYISSEVSKIENSIKSDDSQQALKQLAFFVQLASEHKR